MPCITQEGQVKTNNVGLAYAEQSALGAIPDTGWTLTEPNGISTFGAETTTVARAPISQNRQRRKGAVVDLDSAVEFDADLTVSSFRDFVEGFLFSSAKNGNVTGLDATNADATGDEYQGLAALTAGQALVLDLNALLWVTGGVIPANNGLKTVAVAASTSDTTIQVAEALEDEAAAFEVSIAGRRIPSATGASWTWDGANAQATLGSVGITAFLQQQNVTVGQIIHIGSITQIGGAIQNAFTNSGANDMFGYARVLDFVNADNVLLDRVDDALQFTDAGGGSDIDVTFGEFIRNVPVDDPDFCEKAYCFEAAFPGLGDGTVGNTDTAYQYALDNYCNTLGFNLPLTDKATIDYAFVGTDTNNPTTTRATGADVQESPKLVAPFNTTADLARLRISKVDESGLTTDFKSLTLNMNNNVSPEKVLGKLGARFMNYGNFEIDIEAQLLFTNPLVINAIRDNETLSMDFYLKNDDGVICVDIPSMTLGGGGREFPVNESVLINTTAQAFGDPILNTSIGVSIIPIPFA